MNELSLFTGAGGGLIASSLFMGIRTIGYVEWEDYAQRVISRRIKDGHLHEAPIFSDIRAFNSEGYSKSYREVADIITGGFPCQPFSAAGLRKAENDPRNMWPSTKETIRIVQPRFLFLENVHNLLSLPYIQYIFGSLAEIGYNAKWTVLSAKDIGSFLKRDRVWIFAEKILPS